MHPDLIASRRILIRAYRAYVEADVAWESALNDAATLVPDVRHHNALQIGAPDSRLRRLYEARSHALDVLLVTRDKHRTAIQRRIRRLEQPQRVETETILLIH